MKYEIWHQTDNPKVSHIFAGIVTATSVQDAWTKAQNGINQEWEKLNQRSTMVGDIIETPTGERYLVDNIGFSKIFNFLKTPAD
jgi:hypothetical protein